MRLSPHPQTQKNSLITASAITAMLTALGIAYGDIGTSVLYAVNLIFFGLHPITTTPENVYGAIGLVFWTITIIVTIQYICFVLRADHEGEGGAFAMLSIVRKYGAPAAFVTALLFSVGFLLGDGFITAPISILSAVEGLTVATTAFKPFVTPITLIILTLLFAVQHKGTAHIGRFFGPIICIWFFSIGIMGACHIVHNPEIVFALNPLYALKFLVSLTTRERLEVLGAVMLVITGGEALYADMGHIGAQPIRRTWLALVYPSLLLCYFGQGAYLLSGKEIIHGNIFFSMVPTFALYPMVLLATFATIIASQALITGMFSLAAQGINLKLMPKMRIIHTHPDHPGQIYLPAVNTFLYIGCALLVLNFKTSAELGAAYGFSVSGGMFITSIVLYIVAVKMWHWNKLGAASMCTFFAAANGVFLVANSHKFFEGAYIPVLISIALFIVMTTWQWGRKRLADALRHYANPMQVGWLLLMKKRLDDNGGVFIENEHRFLELDRATIFLNSYPIESWKDQLPASLQVNVYRNGSIPRCLFLLHIEQLPVPHVVAAKRYTVIDLGRSVFSIRARFGFMELPNLQTIVDDIRPSIDLDLEHTTLKVGKEEIILEDGLPLFTKLRLRLFKFMMQMSVPAYRHFGITPDMAAHLSETLIPVRFGATTTSVCLPDLEMNIAVEADMRLLNSNN